MASSGTGTGSPCAHDRCEAVVTIAYEAQARIRDPVYGCVAHIFALQQQVAYLQAQLTQVKAQLVQTAMNSHNIQNQWQGTLPYPTYANPISPQSSLDSVELSGDIDNMNMQEIQSREEFYLHGYPKKRPYNNDLGELQALALRMMRN
ncbi:hypothetical protein V6N12_058876 [Hibiscus sabdariffa]|uniref:LOB domain-containing protein n=1 Tax=Hibiscus sabdariffa TaxID=183260 RepID=A0ABR2ETZ3_9ROSI